MSEAADSVRETDRVKVRPSFTQGHYEKVADALNRASMELIASTPTNQAWLVDRCITKIVSRLVILFQSDNPRFDVDRFLVRAFKTAPVKSEGETEG